MNKLYLCEKPSQAADIAKVLGNARKTSTHWETDGGRVTWCFGHLLELNEPEDYDTKYKRWNYGDLPIIPTNFQFSAKRDAAAQLKAIGQLLNTSASVVISTDADREGEMIGREVLAHHRYKGPVDRLWLSAMDEESVRKALGRLKPGSETISLYHAALARSEADWLVGMNMTRAMTIKTTGGTFSIGRVQTPTVALVVRRDHEIANFKPKDFFEVIAHARTASGAEAALTHAPKEVDRIWDLSKAKLIAAKAHGAKGPIRRETSDKRQPPPKLFSLSGLQKRANVLWGWSADKTLSIAQSLYETHKATSYPRTDCEFLPEEQLGDVPAITAKLVGTDAFKHLKGQAFTPRKTVFNTSKITAHHAIIPTKAIPSFGSLSSDELSAYRLISSHYLANLLPDYEYKSTKLSMKAADVEFSTIGITPGLPGWKIAFGTGAVGESESSEKTLPNIPDGTPALIERTQVDGKKTKPPAAYTEGTLIEDMQSIAKFVTDPEKKAKLKETSGIGTEATRANILKTIRDREYVVPKGKLILSTAKGRALIAALDKELPALADPGETAAWEEGLEQVASGKQNPEAFVSAIGDRIRDYVTVLGKKPDAPRESNAPGQAPGKPTGQRIGTAEIIDHGEFYTAQGAFPGRIYKDKWGHKVTAPEIVRLVAGKETIEVTDCKTRDGKASGPRKLRFNADKKPYPDVEVLIDTPISQATTATSPRKGGGNIQDHGEFFTAPGYESAGRPVRFYKTLAGVTLTADKLAEILTAKDEGVLMRGFKKADGSPFKSDPFVIFNARRKPFPGLEFDFRKDVSVGAEPAHAAAQPAAARSAFRP